MRMGVTQKVINIPGNAATATTAAACSGNAATATTAASCSGNAATATTAASCSGNAATATTAANGGVTSVNGQTGAIVDTTFGAIGGLFFGCANPDISVNTTCAGSTLKNDSTAMGGSNPGLSGTWRSLGKCTDGASNKSLYVRIS